MVEVPKQVREPAIFFSSSGPGSSVRLRREPMHSWRNT
jgi:hypothetical protein